MIMPNIDNLRNSIISKLLTIVDKEYLSALNKFIEASRPDSQQVSLSEEQKIMLQMSEKDIKNERMISNKDIENNDLEWLRKK